MGGIRLLWFSFVMKETLQRSAQSSSIPSEPSIAAAAAVAAAAAAAAAGNRAMPMPTLASDDGGNSDDADVDRDAMDYRMNETF